jgi:putative endonuclease
MELGRAAEEAVAAALVEAGFEIVARNLRVGRLELDVVARRSELVIVVEVRTRGRGARTTGFGSLSAVKRDRIRRAAGSLWRRRYARDPSVSRLRIDAAAVTFDAGETHITYCAGAVVFEPPNRDR